MLWSKTLLTCTEEMKTWLLWQQQPWTIHSISYRSKGLWRRTFRSSWGLALPVILETQTRTLNVGSAVLDAHVRVWASNMCMLSATLPLWMHSLSHTLQGKHNHNQYLSRVSVNTAQLVKHILPTCFKWRFKQKLYIKDGHNHGASSMVSSSVHTGPNWFIWISMNYMFIHQ